MREQDFKENAIWAAIARIQTGLESFSVESKEDFRFIELKKRNEYLSWLLEQSDSAFFSPSELQQMTNELGTIMQYLPSDAANWQYFEVITNVYTSIFARVSYPRIKKIFKSEANAVIDELKLSALEVSEKTKLTVIDLEKKYEAMATMAESYKTRVDAIDTEIKEIDQSLKG